MPRLTFSLLTLVLIGPLPGCQVFGPGEGASGPVTVRTVGEGLLLTNQTPARVYYFVVGRETAQVLFWGPHLDGEASVAPGATVRIAHAEIFRSETEQEAIVYWWHADGKQGQRRPGPIQSFVIEL